MSTYAPEAHPYRRFHVNPWLVAVLVLVAGLVALGTWTVVDRYTGSEPQATQIIDELNSAVNSGDAAAVQRLFAKDAVFVTPDGTEASGLENVVNVALTPHAGGLQLERVAPVSSERNFAATFVGYGDQTRGMAGVEMVVLEFRNGKIVRQWVYNHGYQVVGSERFPPAVAADLLVDDDVPSGASSNHRLDQRKPMPLTRGLALAARSQRACSSPNARIACSPLGSATRSADPRWFRAGGSAVVTSDEGGG